MCSRVHSSGGYLDFFPNSACANHNLACADHNLSDATTGQHHADSAFANHDFACADHNLAIILVYLVTSLPANY
jgi:hypothetical protein